MSKHSNRKRGGLFLSPDELPQENENMQARWTGNTIAE
jgi:hypothetical protein